MIKKLVETIRQNSLKQTIQKEVQKLQYGEIFTNCEWLDKDTFICWELSIPNKLKELLRGFLSEEKKYERNWLAVEYWKDENKLKYLLVTDKDTVCINNYLESDYFNGLVLRKMEEVM